MLTLRFGFSIVFFFLSEVGRYGDEELFERVCRNSQYTKRLDQGGFIPSSAKKKNDFFLAEF